MADQNTYVLEIDFKTPDKKPESEIVDKEVENKTDNITMQDARSFFKKVGVGTVAADAFRWQASLVGRNTGSSLMQEKVNSMMSIAGASIGIATAFAAGGVVGGIAATAMVSMKLIKDVEQYNYETRWENIGLSLSRERLGSSAAVNRSRNV